MNLQVLVATMGQIDCSLLDKMNIQTDAVVINQCDKECKQEFEHNGHNIIWIDTTERGLSKSRNMAINEATAEICLIADEDEILKDNYFDEIIKAFDCYQSAAIIRFQIKGIEKKFKDYPSNTQKLGYLKSMRASSVELAFKREKIIGKGIRFDELIGAGTEFLMGEENTFLFHCLGKRLELYYFPTVIADLHIGSSTWFTGYDDRYFIGRGAAFTAMSKRLSIILILQFALRHRDLCVNNMSICQAIKYMKQGKKEYLRRLKVCLK